MCALENSTLSHNPCFIIWYSTSLFFDFSLDYYGRPFTLLRNHKQEQRRRRTTIHARPDQQQNYKELNIDTSKLYNELLDAIKRDKSSVGYTNEPTIAATSAYRRGIVRGAPSIANYVMNVSKNEERTNSPSSRQLIEFALPNERQSNGGGYAAAESYWTGKAETGPIISDPLPIINPSLQGAVGAGFMTPQTTPNFNFIATAPADPFEGNTYEPSELSPAEGPQVIQLTNQPKPSIAVAKHATAYPPVTTLHKSKTPQQHPAPAPSPVVAMPTPKPFVMRRHTGVTSPAAVLPEPVGDRGNKRLLKTGNSNSREIKNREEPSKRVYSLGDNGEFFVVDFLSLYSRKNASKKLRFTFK